MLNSSLNSSSNSDEITRYLNSIFVLLFGLPWNAIVIGTILKKKLYSHPSVMLILNLAISNFLVYVCLLIMPPIFIFGLGDFGNADIFEVCQVSFLRMLLPAVSNLTITLLSVDRVYIPQETSHISFDWIIGS